MYILKPDYYVLHQNKCYTNANSKYKTKLLHTLQHIKVLSCDTSVRLKYCLYIRYVV